MTVQQVKDERTAGAVQSHTSCYASAHQLVCGHRGYTSRGSKSCPLPISYDCYLKDIAYLRRKQALAYIVVAA